MTGSAELSDIRPLIPGAAPGFRAQVTFDYKVCSRILNPKPNRPLGSVSRAAGRSMVILKKTVTLQGILKVQEKIRGHAELLRTNSLQGCCPHHNLPRSNPRNVQLSGKGTTSRSRRPRRSGKSTPEPRQSCFEQEQDGISLSAMSYELRLLVSHNQCRSPNTVAGSPKVKTNPGDIHLLLVVAFQVL